MARRALLVGLNRYPSPTPALRGCLNDVAGLRALLCDRFAFPPADVRVLTDAAATTGAIRAELSRLAGGARPGDVLVFHFAGHGSQVRDIDGDEPGDGLDETLCPSDYLVAPPFTDEQLHDAVRRVPAGVNFAILLDCCHAGSGLQQLGPAARRSALLARPTFPAWVRSVQRSGVPAEPTGARRPVCRLGRRAVSAGAVLVAACRAAEVSADTCVDGSYHGVLTYFLCRALERCERPPTYARLLRSIGALLRERGLAQEPQLECPRGAEFHPVFTPLEV